MNLGESGTVKINVTQDEDCATKISIQSDDSVSASKLMETRADLVNALSGASGFMENDNFMLNIAYVPASSGNEMTFDDARQEPRQGQSSSVKGAARGGGGSSGGVMTRPKSVSAYGIVNVIV